MSFMSDIPPSGDSGIGNPPPVAPSDTKEPSDSVHDSGGHKFSLSSQQSSLDVQPRASMNIDSADSIYDGIRIAGNTIVEKRENAYDQIAKKFQDEAFLQSTSLDKQEFTALRDSLFGRSNDDDDDDSLDLDSEDLGAIWPLLEKAKDEEELREIVNDFTNIEGQRKELAKLEQKAITNNRTQALGILENSFHFDTKAANVFLHRYSHSNDAMREAKEQLQRLTCNNETLKETREYLNEQQDAVKALHDLIQQELVYRDDQPIESVSVEAHEDVDATT